MSPAGDQHLTNRVVRDAVSKMNGYSVDPTRKTAVPLGLKVVFGAVFGICAGTVVATLSGKVGLFYGFAGGLMGVAAVVIIKAVQAYMENAKLAKMHMQAHYLDEEATRLEVELARQSGAFDRWKKQ